ncbi:hypothetical protein BHE74_00009387 [Ensete ventricosum]|nr:hypothetical protein BHE74_00009387 [Ensete ventricosum]
MPPGLPKSSQSLAVPGLDPLDRDPTTTLGRSSARIQTGARRMGKTTGDGLEAERGNETESVKWTYAAGGEGKGEGWTEGKEGRGGEGGRTGRRGEEEEERGEGGQEEERRRAGKEEKERVSGGERGYVEVTITLPSSPSPREGCGPRCTGVGLHEIRTSENSPYAPSFLMRWLKMRCIRVSGLER